MNLRNQLENLERAERKAWNAKMRASEADTCTLYGQEGKNELAWRVTADACFSFRQQHGLIGVPTRMVRG